jgi:hypothetical protein
VQAGATLPLCPLPPGLCPKELAGRHIASKGKDPCVAERVFISVSLHTFWLTEHAFRIPCATRHWGVEAFVWYLLCNNFFVHPSAGSSSKTPDPDFSCLSLVARLPLRPWKGRLRLVTSIAPRRRASSTPMRLGTPSAFTAPWSVTKQVWLGNWAPRMPGCGVGHTSPLTKYVSLRLGAGILRLCGSFRGGMLARLGAGIPPAMKLVASVLSCLLLWCQLRLRETLAWLEAWISCIFSRGAFARLSSASPPSRLC